MNRLSVLFSVTGFALSAVPVDFRSPLSIQPNGKLVAKIIVNDREITSTGIYCGSSTLIGRFLDKSYKIALGDVHDRSQQYSLHIPTQYGSSGHEMSHSLGIGSRSFLTQQAGTVAVIRLTATEAELVIGSTIDYFVANCKPETLIRLEASPVTGFVTVELNLVGDGLSTSIGPRNVDITPTAPGKVNALPPSVYHHISGLLVSAGAKEENEITRKFWDCTEAMIAGLPKMEMRFASGILSLSPPDYVAFYREENACQLRFALGPETRAFQMDPLMLENKNVRVSRDNTWEICDSLASL